MISLARTLIILAVCTGFGCSDSSNPVGPTPDASPAVDMPKPSIDGSAVDGAAADQSVPDAAPVVDAGPAPDVSPLKCFEFSTDPEMPLAIDGAFVATTTLWRRPHDEPEVCPATALLPSTAPDVPFVAYAFCNNDTKPHKFDFEMRSQAGPNGETPLDDPYLILYKGKNIPTDAKQCAFINDDIPNAMNTKDSEITSVTVEPGGSITMVGTTFTFDPKDGTGMGGYLMVVWSAD